MIEGAYKDIVYSGNMGPIALNLANAWILHLTCNAEIFNKPQVWLWPKKQVTLYYVSRDRSDRGESTCNLPTKAVKLPP